MKHKYSLLSAFFLLGTLLLYGQTSVQFKYFIGGEPCLQFPYALTTDSHSNLLVLDFYNSSIHRIDSTGKYLDKIRLPMKGSDTSTDPVGIATDTEDNIYLSGWASNSILKLNKEGKIIVKFGDQDNSNGNIYNPLGITVSQDGFIFVADSYNHRIQKFDQSGKFLMSFGSYGSANGQFNLPLGIDIDKNNTIYVCDLKNSRIQKFDQNGKFLDTFGSYGTQDGELNSANAITIDSKGNIYVTDPRNARIQKFDAAGKFTWKSDTTLAKSNEKILYPTSITTDQSDNVYTLDIEGKAIVKLTNTGKVLWKFNFSIENRLVNFPKHIAQDIFDNLYVMDQKGILKFDSQGNFLLKFDDQKIPLPFPSAIVTDRMNNVYVVDNAKIIKFDPYGNPLLTFSSQGITQPISIGGIATDNLGNIYVADGINQYIYVFDSEGILRKKIALNSTHDTVYISAMAIDRIGLLYICYYNSEEIYIEKITPTGKITDTYSIQSPFDPVYNFPYENKVSLAVDNSDNIYVTVPNSSSIKKINSLTKSVETIGNYGSRVGEFDNPCSIVVNPRGFIYVSDNRNSRISVFSFPTIPIDSYISGIVFNDTNGNCIKDSSESFIPSMVIEAGPGPLGPLYALTDLYGQYTIPADTGTYTIKQSTNNNNKTLVVEPNCPANGSYESLRIEKKNTLITNINFANKVTLLPYLSSNVSSDRRRRCFANTTVVHYSNTGYADAANVKVFVKLPQHVIFKSADKAYTIDKDSNYVFTIGSLKANESGSIHITDSVACQRNITGLTACTKVWITPSNNYTLPADSPWDQSDITLSGKCIENGRVKLVIHNSGKAMADSSAFRIYLDGKLAMQKYFKLTAGDSLVLRVPANGKTIRLEADQREGHPRKAQSNLTIEGCVATSSDIVSKGFVDALPQDDTEPEVSISCLPIIDSFDPNDKLVSPIGTTSEHYTPTRSELKYTIRFQNTGTDYAYTVTIIDTLSDKLDIASLQLGAASHKYSFNVSGKGKPVLTFTFNNINLPDSTRDQKGSNGFVQFSIKPKENLPEKTRIENFADIIFDYNEPVRTNTTTNVMYDLTPVVDNGVKLTEKGVVFLKPTIASFTPVQASFGEQMTITGMNYQTVAADNIVKINGVRATVVSASETELIVTVPQAVTAGKVSVTTLGGTATSEVDFVLGSEQPQWSRSIRVYPNPSQGRFTVDLSGSATVIDRIEVVNALGQKIVSQNVSKTSLKQDLDLSGHSAGFYLVVFHSQAGNATRKIIIR